MKSAIFSTVRHPIRQKISRYGRLSGILVGRAAHRAVRAVKNRFQRPERSFPTAKPDPGWTTSRKLRSLRLLCTLQALRLFRAGTKNPGWTVATITGTIVIVLLAIVQFSSLSDDSASASEPLFEPFLQSSHAVEHKHEQTVSEQNETQNETVQSHPSQMEAGKKPEFDIDIFLLPDPWDSNGAEQFLVTSVRGIHPLADVAAQGEDNGLWKPTLNGDEQSDIQPTRHLDPAFGSENPFARSFADPFESRPAERDPVVPTVQVPSSTAAVALTLVDTPRLHLVVTLPERTELGRPGRIHFRVINVGSMTAENVVLGIEIPEEFTCFKGRSLEYKVGTIPPGETRLARLTPVAAKSGEAEYEIDLTADTGFSFTLNKQVQVVTQK